jgi:hypothetical protein
MEEKDFLEKMENLKKPEVSAEASKQQLKLAVMNTKKTAAWGLWFLVVPVFFLVCVTIKEFLHWQWGVSEQFTEWMGALDQNPSSWWLTPVLFVLLPAIGAVINLLAIMHFAYDKARRELIVTIKLKWLNLTLAIISIAIVGMVCLYGLIETAAERAIHKIEQAEQHTK